MTDLSGSGALLIYACPVWHPSMIQLSVELWPHSLGMLQSNKAVTLWLGMDPPCRTWYKKY